MGALIGFAVVLWISIVFIFPDNILKLKLVDITIADILRIIGGIVVALIGGAIGAFVDEVRDL